MVSTHCHVIVIGAGIGGLTAPLSLQRHGFRVSVYEQASEFKEFGAGLPECDACTRISGSRRVNRIKRVREACVDLLGRGGTRWRVVRTSNAYIFNDPASKSDFQTGTAAQAASKKEFASNVPRERRRGGLC
jgi:protoporphyrinogen oxidase